jgi:uncharacterized protein (PEP-CTERM system associated)
MASMNEVSIEVPCRVCRRLVVVLGCFSLLPMALHAGEWDITPSISLAQIYTDNVDLEPDNERDAYITEVSPGISLSGGGGRFTANIDYRMQNFFSSENNFSPNTNHQLNASTTTELARDLFFLDADSSAGQTLLDAGGTRSRDNFTDNRNRTTVWTYSVSPYLTPHFGEFADAILRYRTGGVIYSKGEASDSRIHNVSAGINSGRHFSTLTWGADYNYTKQNRDSSSASDVTYEEVSGNAQYRLTRYLRLDGNAGYTNDDFDSSDDFDNGTYWSVGAFYQRSRFWSAGATKGRNLTTATLGLFPTRRTALTIDYRDQDVGRRSTGETWTGTFSHTTRRSSWSATYIEDTTTSQERQLEDQGGFLLVDPVTGEPNPNPQPGDVVVEVPLGPTTSLTDEVQERKRGQGTVGFNTGKSGLRATVFYQKTRSLESLDEEETRGINGSWNFRLAPRTNSILSANWDRSTGNRNDRGDSDYWYVQASLRRQIRTNLNGSLTYRFQRQDSDDDDNDYDENSVIARLTATF